MTKYDHQQTFHSSDGCVYAGALTAAPYKSDLCKLEGNFIGSFNKREVIGAQ